MEWWRAIILTVCIVAGCIITSMLADDFLEREDKEEDEWDK